VELSNFNRQALYRNKGIGNGKAKYANEELKKVNPNVKVEAISEMINKDNVDELVSNFGVIVDAMDDFPTRYLLNKSAMTKKIS